MRTWSASRLTQEKPAWEAEDQAAARAEYKGSGGGMTWTSRRPGATRSSPQPSPPGTGRLLRRPRRSGLAGLHEPEGGRAHRGRVMEVHKDFPAHPENYQRGRAQPVSFLVFHYVGATEGARNNAKYYHDRVLKISAHYL